MITTENQPVQHEPASQPAEAGDYVLATKWSDGDPCDHFCVGWVTGYTEHGRYLVAGRDGTQMRHNGFRRAEAITREEGTRLVQRFEEISDKPGPSLWEHLHEIRNHKPTNP